MRCLSFLSLLFAVVLPNPIPGACDELANQCMNRLAQLTSADQCGMPPPTAAKALDPETLDWGVCACPKLVPIFECLKAASARNCPGAKQYLMLYGDQVDKGCRIVDWAKKQQQPSKKFQYFWN